MALSRKTKIIGMIGGGVLLVLIILISVLATRKDTPEVTVVKVERRPELRSTVTSSGEVRPIQFMNITSEVQGRIEDIYVKEGDHVTKGQPLVRLDPDQLQSNTDAQTAAFQTAQDEIRVSQSQVTAAQNSLSQSQQQYNDAQARLAQQSIAVRDSRRAVDTANLSVSSSQSRANQSAAQLRGQKNQRDKTMQVAPISGVVAEIPSKVGTFAVASLSSTALMTIADMST